MKGVKKRFPRLVATRVFPEYQCLCVTWGCEPTITSMSAFLVRFFTIPMIPVTATVVYSIPQCKNKTTTSQLSYNNYAKKSLQRKLQCMRVARIPESGCTWFQNDGYMRSELGIKWMIYHSSDFWMQFFNDRNSMIMLQVIFYPIFVVISKIVRSWRETFHTVK